MLLVGPRITRCVRVVQIGQPSPQSTRGAAPPTTLGCVATCPSFWPETAQAYTKRREEAQTFVRRPRRLHYGAGFPELTWP